MCFKRSNLNALFLLLLISFSLISYAQKKDTIITFEPIQITANSLLKEKALVKIKLDSAVLQQEYSANLSEALSSHSPIFVKTYGQGSLATVSMRGTAASHTQVEWNGININSPMLGQVDFSQIPVWFIDQIEILPGSSSLQNGGGAIGGSVNISSVPSFNRKFYGSVLQSVGSFETCQSFIQVGGGTSKLQFRLRVFNETSKNNFEYYNNANGLWNYEKQQNAEFSKQGLLSEMFYNRKNNSFSMGLWLLKSNRNLPSIMSYQGAGQIETQLDEDIRWSAKWKRFFKLGFSELTTGFSIGNLDYYLANETNLGTYVNYNTQSKSVSGFAKHSLELSFSKKMFLKWNTNIDYSKAWFMDKKTELGFDAKRISVGSSIALFYQLHKRFSTYLLVRDELVDKKIVPLMPSLGFDWSILFLKNLSLKTNISRNYHQPTLNDLYWSPGGNPLLKPEHGYSGDVGLYYSFLPDSLCKITVSATAFASLIKDWIIWQPGEFRYWTATNMQEVFARGFESKMDASATHNKWKFQLSLNYSYTRTANHETDENGILSFKNQLIYIPIHKANSMFNVFYRSFSIHYNVNFTGERYTLASNEETHHSLPWFTLHNIGFGKVFEFNRLKLEVQAKVNNLINTDYQAILWRAMPRRNAQIYVKISF